MSPNHRAFISAASEAFHAEANLIASKWGLTFTNLAQPEIDYCLVLDSAGLALHCPTTLHFKPLFIDFNSNDYLWRGDRAQHELLKKALGKELVKSNPLKIIDATAGLGHDAWLLANLHCQVTLLERSPFLAALLNDAIERANNHPSSQNMHLIHANAITYLKQLNPNDYPDIIYCDPMHPQRNKTALVKKEMCILREIVGEDTDANTLLDVALRCAKKRVIVKRPARSSPLGEHSVDVSYKSRTIRFDVYLK